MARLYKVSAPTISRVIAEVRVKLAHRERADQGKRP
jgi:hypothetical protein